MKYYISDLHLFHTNVTKEGRNYDDRPFQTMEEMLRTIHDNWNARVTNGDTVYILGDISMHGTQGMNEGKCSTYRQGDIPVRAYNVGCMMPYMDYMPRPLAEIVDLAEAYREEE